MARTRYKAGDKPVPLRELPAGALRAVLREGYGSKDFKADVMAGLVVGIVALPLSMALAIAVGVAPQHGLYTAIVAGFVVGLLGGSRTQVTGPTAAFIVVLAPIVTKFGLSGLLIAGLMGGLMLIAMGFARLGRLIQFIPHPVTTGFTAGIGTVIAVLQLKDLLGLEPKHLPEHFIDRVGAFISARGTASGWEFGLGVFTLLMLIFIPRLLTKRVPAPLLAIPIAAVVGWALAEFAGADIATIGSRFHTEINGRIVDGIPQLPPMPTVPWTAGGFELSYDAIRELLPGAFAIAMLGAIESLLSAVIADGVTRTRHDPDAELLALGVGNVVAPFFGGIPATGALARTATNIRSGARSPVAAMVHSIAVLVAILALAPLIKYLPMSSLAGLLILVAWNMSDVKHVGHMMKVAPRSDLLVLLTCYGLTVAFDMVIAVAVGLVLAAFLFMRRMVEITQARLVEGTHPELPGPLPSGVVIYDIAGPLFFGAAQKAMSSLAATSDRAKVVVFRMHDVPAMDATGLVALESALEMLDGQHRLAVITGLRPQPAGVLKKGNVVDRPGKLRIVDDMAEALEVARVHAEGAGKTPT